MELPSAQADIPNETGTQDLANFKSSGPLPTAPPHLVVEFEVVSPGS
jgi:hypothetical protein